ncbi:MAG: LPS assembly protein LptD, partial [Pseudomonadales bacterium]|nr:LPS assembly protein LptD [Pseudomonadales bacterium]
VQGFQNLDPQGQEQYETLPRLSATYFESLSIFEVAMEFEYTNFAKDNENVGGLQGIVGERALADASLSMPLRAVWGFIEPSINVVHRRYDLEDTPDGFRTDPALTTPGFSLDAGLFFDRFFEFRGRELQQTLEPRIFYLYVEEDPQDDLPVFEVSPLTPSFSQLFRENRFTGRDRIGDANQISVAATTRFLQRDTGAEFLSASIGEIWYFKDREVVYQPRPGDDNESSTSAIFTEGRITLENGLRIVGSYEWDHRVNRSNRGKFSLKYNPDDRHIFNLSYIYTSDEVERRSQFRNEEESDLSFIWPLSGKWSLIGRWNYGWDENQTIESLLGVEYNDCCWKSRLVFRRYLKEPRNLTLIVDDPT